MSSGSLLRWKPLVGTEAVALDNTASIGPLAEAPGLLALPMGMGTAPLGREAQVGMGSDASRSSCGILRGNADRPCILSS